MDELIKYPGLSETANPANVRNTGLSETIYPLWTRFPGIGVKEAQGSFVLFLDSNIDE